MMIEIDSSITNDSPGIAYANLSEEMCEKITKLEQTIQKETGEKIAIVAYLV